VGIMIEVLDIKGKKVIFIDEISFGYPLDFSFRPDNDCVFSLDYHFQRREKIGERMMY